MNERVAHRLRRTPTRRVAKARAWTLVHSCATLALVESGLVRGLPRAEIEDVAHPGQTAMVVGAALVALGVAGFVAACSRECDRSESRADCADQRGEREVTSWAPLIALGAPGLVLTGDGLGLYLDSSTRYRDAAVDPSAPP